MHFDSPRSGKSVQDWICDLFWLADDRQIFLCIDRKFTKGLVCSVSHSFSGKVWLETCSVLCLHNFLVHTRMTFTEITRTFDLGPFSLKIMPDFNWYLFCAGYRFSDSKFRNPYRLSLAFKSFFVANLFVFRVLFKRSCLDRSASRF